MIINVVRYFLLGLVMVIFFLPISLLTLTAGVLCGNTSYLLSKVRDMGVDTVNVFENGFKV